MDIVASIGSVTLALVPSIIAAVAATMAAYIGTRNKRRIQDVHVLVDGRLDHTLARVALLEEQLLDARLAGSETVQHITDNPSATGPPFDPDEPYKKSKPT